MSLAKTPDGQEFTAPGFNHEAHDRWVRVGHCPVVSAAKSWCSKKDGHAEPLHGSPNIPAPGREGPYYVEWDK